jgi:hypothetical protein
MNPNQRRLVFGLVLVLLLVVATSPVLLAAGDPISAMAEWAAALAEFASFSFAIVLIIVAAVQAAAGERNGLMYIAGAIFFVVIALNAREIVSMLRF